MQIALKRVQSLEPAGVGARSVAECLLLQLPSIDDAAMRDARRARSSTDHLDRLAAHDVAGLARALEQHAGADRGGVRAHPPPRPAPGLALRRRRTSSTSRPT